MNSGFSSASNFIQALSKYVTNYTSDQEHWECWISGTLNMKNIAHWEHWVWSTSRMSHTVMTFIFRICNYAMADVTSKLWICKIFHTWCVLHYYLSIVLNCIMAFEDVAYVLQVVVQEKKLCKNCTGRYS